MYDFIIGNVIDVIDGDTFDMTVTHYGNHNKYQYNFRERMRIAEMDAPELDTFLGIRSRQSLERQLSNKQVRCYIHSRDTYGRLVAKVEVLRIMNYRHSKLTLK